MKQRQLEYEVYCILEDIKGIIEIFSNNPKVSELKICFNEFEKKLNEILVVETRR